MPKYDKIYISVFRKKQGGKRMAKKVYHDRNTDLGLLARDVELWFVENGYIVESDSTDGAWIVQAKKEETWRKALGAARAFRVLITGEPNNFSVEVGTGNWTSNLAAGGVAAVLTGGASIIGSGLATGWSKKIESDIMTYIDNKVIFGKKEKSFDEKKREESETSLQGKLHKLKEAFHSGILDEQSYKLKTQELEAQHKSQRKDNQQEKMLLQLKESLDAGILTQSEFEAKKAELLKGSLEFERDEKIATLRIALANGILEQAEFDKKKNEIEKEYGIKIEMKKLEDALYSGLITKDQFEQKKIAVMNANTGIEEKIEKLKMALENGIITKEEFEQKKKALEEKPILEAKIKQLEDALYAGIITKEEFEKKKSSLIEG